MSLDYDTAYRAALKGWERSTYWTAAELDVWKWQEKEYPGQFNLAAKLAARRAVRNLIRAELGLDPVGPMGQLDLLGGAA